MVRLVVGLFFIVVPILELALLIKVGQSIGAWMTAALVVTMAFTGILIISRQSFSVLRQSLEAMSEGRPPVTQVLDGLFLMAAGALLLTPGFITDAMALLLLVPPLRRAVARWSIGLILRRAPADMDDDGWPAQHARDDAAGERRGRRDGPVIEGEFERIGDTSRTAPRRNGAGHP